MSVDLAKNFIRLEMKKCLSHLSNETRVHQSKNIMNQLINLQPYENSKRIGIYMSMPEEVCTDELVKHILNNGKECFIPRYNNSTMVMVKLKTIDDFNKLPKNKWSIRQPLENEEREDALLNGGLDLIITPGLAFTIDGKRLGRGKGYYDRYLKKMKLFREGNGEDLITIGLAFKEQVIESLPTTPDDFILDKIVSDMK